MHNILSEAGNTARREANGGKLFHRKKGKIPSPQDGGSVSSNRKGGWKVLPTAHEKA
ncbi:MAG: hypothetical protein IJS21_06420 [Deltaproteobacteria bacterium]|jgi:hypothetical protein|nr:hypothetical protein [Deltaproteobacteria bacterium]MBQ7249641.1 hypothetical protein [Deltaproteobacteria bacterium]